VPVGALAAIEDGAVLIRGMVADVTGHPMLREEIRGSQEDACFLGRELARRLLGKGGRGILERLYGEAAPEIEAP
jgi:porphobilinogen deaminase